MNTHFQLIIIGGGSAGYQCAIKAAALGVDVCVVEPEKLGGDSLNVGCVPSKSFLKVANVAFDLSKSSLFGLECKKGTPKFSNIKDYIFSVVNKLHGRVDKELRQFENITVIKGSATFSAENAVVINDVTYTGDHLIVATGAKAFLPPVPGLNTDNCYTSSTLFTMEDLPNRLIVLGGGPVGLEFGQAFSILGSHVDVVDRSDRLFSHEEPEVADAMLPVLRDSGMTLHLKAALLEIEKLQNGAVKVKVEKDGKIEELYGDAVLVCLGRTPNTDSLGLDEIGVKRTERGCIEINDHCQSSLPNIYACGDVAGPYQFTHTAWYQADLIINNLYNNAQKSLDYKAISWTTYTIPEVSRAGMTEKEARDQGVFGSVVHMDFSKCDRALLNDDIAGFIKLVLDLQGKILGVSIVSRIAGELLATASLAIHQGLDIKTFESMMFSYPTEATIYRHASMKHMFNQLGVLNS